MGFFDKFRRKNEEESKAEEVELGEKALENVDAGYQDRVQWLENQIDKMQKEIAAGNLTPDQKYQYEVIIKKYQEELNNSNYLIR